MAWEDPVAWGDLVAQLLCWGLALSGMGASRGVSRCWVCGGLGQEFGVEWSRMSQLPSCPQHPEVVLLPGPRTGCFPRERRAPAGAPPASPV